RPSGDVDLRPGRSVAPGGCEREVRVMAKPKAKSKADQAAELDELANVWPDPPVTEIGATERTLSNKAYRRALADLQVELAKLQEWVREKGLRIVVLFEGRDAAGKGGAIKTISLG